MHVKYINTSNINLSYDTYYINPHKYIEHILNLLSLNQYQHLGFWKLYMDVHAPSWRLVHSENDLPTKLLLTQVCAPKPFSMPKRKNKIWLENDSLITFKYGNCFSPQIYHCFYGQSEMVVSAVPDFSPTHFCSLAIMSLYSQLFK